jgi:hypothetical protein
MAEITLLRKSTIPKDNGSYRMSLEITAAKDIPKYAFVKQRIRNFIEDKFDDNFVAICTPAQLEDFDTNSPAEGSSYFRSDKIDIVSRNLAYLEQVFHSIIGELQKLVDDYESLNVLIEDGIYTITADHIELNTAVSHTHYRMPLTAAPCGTNSTFVDGDDTRHIVGSQDTDLEGWLNTTGSDPVGYKFKYNIAEDSALNNLWPPHEDKLSYARLEVNGLPVTTDDVRITEEGIFWKPNLLGEAPWPQDWASTLNTGSDQYQATLVLDFIV